MNTEVHRTERAAWEKGYREALLDVYCFMTQNPQVLEIDPEHLSMLYAMGTQAESTLQVKAAV